MTVNDSVSGQYAIYHRIENVKSANEAQVAEAAIALLDKLQATGSGEFKRVLQRYATQTDA